MRLRSWQLNAVGRSRRHPNGDLINSFWFYLPRRSQSFFLVSFFACSQRANRIVDIVFYEKLFIFTALHKRLIFLCAAHVSSFAASTSSLHKFFKVFIAAMTALWHSFTIFERRFFLILFRWCETALIIIKKKKEKIQKKKQKKTCYLLLRRRKRDEAITKQTFLGLARWCRCRTAPHHQPHCKWTCELPINHNTNTVVGSFAVVVARQQTQL